MYYFLNRESINGIERHIIRRINADTVQSFYDVESNTGPERQDYLAWVAEGNTAEEWSPDAN